MLKSILCDYSDACILAKGTKAIVANATAAPDRNNKQKILKTCTIY